MLRFLAEKILWFGILTGAVITVSGFLVPWFPILELPNHFRPFVWIATAMMAMAAYFICHRRLRSASMVLFFAVSILLLLPLIHAAPSASTSQPFIRIATLNLFAWNRRFDDIATFVEQSGADIVVFQEVNCSHAEPLFQRLQRSYPYILRFPTDCFGQALLSKQPWLASGRINEANRSPLFIWAQFSRNGIEFDVTGIHLEYPFSPDKQALHIDRLIAHLASRSGRQIVAGDFNHTPFSWKLAKLCHTTGLRRHATFLASWAADWSVPIFLIDNVLSTRDFSTINAQVGPNVGSDHLPLVVDLALSKP